jgi:flagellar secretion chaperone FliS
VNTAVAAYRQNTIDTASPGQLIVMLYRGVLYSLDLAESALEAPVRDLDRAHRELTRAQDIVFELLQTLDMGVQPISDSLAALYQYCMNQLIAANVTKAFAPAMPVRAVFADLAEAWGSIVGGEAA